MKQLIFTILLFCSVAASAQVPYIIFIKDSTATPDPTPVPPTAATPTFSPGAGEVSSGTAVTITTATTGAAIRYTTDGSTPTASSTLYVNPILVSQPITLKAIAIKPGFTNSAVGSAAYTITAPSPTGFRPRYPRFGAYTISNKEYTSAFLERAEKFSVLVLGTWPTYTSSGRNVAQIVDRLHDSAKNQLKVFLYTVLNEESKGNLSGTVKDEGFDARYTAWPGFYDFLSAFGNNGSGFLTNSIDSFVSSTWPGKTFTNLTNAAGTGAFSRRWNRAMPYMVDRAIRLGLGSSVGMPNVTAAKFDGYMVDNFFAQPAGGVVGDWNRDGINESAASVGTAYRAGMLEMVDEYRDNCDTCLVMGNMIQLRGTVPFGNYANVLNAHLMESAIGEDASPATPWAYYQKMSENVLDPGIVLFCARSDTNMSVSANRDAMRYNLTVCLMGDGYFYQYHQKLRYDQELFQNAAEYSFDLGYPVTNSKGNPVFTKNLRDNANVLTGYYREFDNGIVICNPPDAGSRTYLLLGTYYKIKGLNSGVYASTTGDGTGITSITLNAGSGIILSRTPTN